MRETHKCQRYLHMSAWAYTYLCHAKKRLRRHHAKLTEVPTSGVEETDILWGEGVWSKGIVAKTGWHMVKLISSSF